MVLSMTVALWAGNGQPLHAQQPGDDCANVGPIAVSDITQNSARISFSDPGPSWLYEISYRLTSETTWSTTYASAIPVDLSGLRSCSTYEVKIRRHCNTLIASNGYTPVITFNTVNMNCGSGPPPRIGDGNATCFDCNLNCYNLVCNGDFERDELKAPTSNTVIGLADGKNYLPGGSLVGQPLSGPGTDCWVSCFSTPDIFGTTGTGRPNFPLQVPRPDLTQSYLINSVPQTNLVSQDICGNRALNLASRFYKEYDPARAIRDLRPPGNYFVNEGAVTQLRGQLVRGQRYRISFDAICFVFPRDPRDGPMGNYQMEPFYPCSFVNYPCTLRLGLHSSMSDIVDMPSFPYKINGFNSTNDIITQLIPVSPQCGTPAGVWGNYSFTYTGKAVDVLNNFLSISALQNTTMPMITHDNIPGIDPLSDNFTYYVLVDNVKMIPIPDAIPARQDFARTLCPNASYVVSEFSNSTIPPSCANNYRWRPATGVSDVNSLTPTIKPATNTTYTLEFSPSGFSQCNDVATIGTMAFIVGQPTTSPFTNVTTMQTYLTSIGQGVGIRYTEPGQGGTLTVNLGTVTVQGANETTYPPLSLAFAQNFTINQSVKLLGANMQFGAEAQLRVAKGQTLTLDKNPRGEGSTLSSCLCEGNNTWPGIVVVPADAATGTPLPVTVLNCLEGTTIRNATNGISAIHSVTRIAPTGRVRLNLDKALMENNTRHILMKHINNVSTGVAPFTMVGCTLQSTPNCPNPTTVGIEALEVYSDPIVTGTRPGITVGAAGQPINVIRDMTQKGIFAANTSLICMKTEFGRPGGIVRTENLIFISRDVFTKTTGPTLQMDRDGPNRCTFDNCTTAISVLGTKSANIAHCVINDFINQGIFIDKLANNDNCVVDDNQISNPTNRGTGILLTRLIGGGRPNPSTFANVIGNEINKVNCGIKLENARDLFKFDITDNVINDVQQLSSTSAMSTGDGVGILVNACVDPALFCTVNNNKISNFFSDGIMLLENTRSILFVDNNDINSILPTPTPIYQSRFGIRAVGIDWGATGPVVNVTNNRVKHCYWGIYFYKAVAAGGSGVGISGNDINNISNIDLGIDTAGTGMFWGPTAGITLKQCKTPIFTSNNVIYDQSPFTGTLGTFTSTGIYVDGSGVVAGSQQFCNNEVYNLARGFIGARWCPGTLLLRNNFHDNRNCGVLVTHRGVIGDQFTTVPAITGTITFDNKWNANGSGTTRGLDLFTAVGTNGTSSRWRVSNDLPASQLRPDRTLDDRTGTAMPVSVPPTVGGYPSETCSDIPQYVAGIQQPFRVRFNDPEDPENSIQQEYNQGYSMFVDPDSLPFTYRQLTQMKQMADDEPAAMNLDSAWSYQRYFSLYYTIRETPALRTNSAKLRRFYRDFRKHNFADIAEIYETIGQLNTDTARRASIRRCIRVNDGMVPTNVAEANHKLFFDIRLQMLRDKVDTLNPVQLEAMKTIARQCPLDGGQAVDDARAILAYIGIDSLPGMSRCMRILPEHMLIDSMASMIRQGADDSDLNQALNDDQPMQLAVYPNPASDHLSVHYDLGQATQATLRVYDVTGRLVHSEELTNSNGVIALQLGHWPAGLYSYYVKDILNRSLTDKFIISR
jgi:hypothetical protein